ncbi:MAG TPA: 4-hydroxythreonine-4-phosphate dehydrogenase PdxA [Candidatus Paceibacterota bacterium]|nr:4-hydroxythreonine-4-phosphate dehydrogenase PdxA [Candidatus Paceibacterota bacterium]
MWLGISLGDITGIGPEVTLKALAAENLAEGFKFLIIGDEKHLRDLNQRLNLKLPIQTYKGSSDSSGIFVCNPLSEPLPTNLPAGSPIAARAAVAWLKDAAERCLRSEIAGMITAPVSKESIIRAGRPFVGQTEFLSELAGTERTVMMLLGHDDRGRWLRVALVTTHVPIKYLAAQITQPKVELAIEMAAQACRDLGLPRARVAVCGLNPHAGEGGKIGDEEILVVNPAVASAQSRKLDVVGPLSADTLFHEAYNGSYDAIVAMYHDQGLAPLKMVAFESGVNWTLGLPFVRTSPDHGTAYNIAGKGIADSSSMTAAIRLAKQLALARR